MVFGPLALYGNAPIYLCGTDTPHVCLCVFTHLNMKLNLCVNYTCIKL